MTFARQTFTFMQEYRGVLRNMVMRYAADLAAQALVMSLDTQLPSPADRAAAAGARPNARKVKKKQRMPGSETQGTYDNDQASTAPSDSPPQPSSPSRHSRLVMKSGGSALALLFATPCCQPPTPLACC